MHRIMRRRIALLPLLSLPVVLLCASGGGVSGGYREYGSCSADRCEHIQSWGV
jgi:hypothetical protein